MKIRHFLVLFTLCCLLFLLMMFSVSYHANWVTILDKIGYSLTQPTTSFKTQLMIFLTHFGDPAILQLFSIVFALFLWGKHKYRMSLWFIFAQFIGYGLILLIKYSVMRPRPTEKLFPTSGYSFPSGHTFATAILLLCLCTILIPHLKSTTSKFLFITFCALWILIIMYTRVYLRDHYTSDVIAGLLLALVWWLLVSRYRGKISHHLLRHPNEE